MIREESVLLEGKVIFTPEKFSLGVIELQDKRHIFFDEAFKANTGNLIKVGDCVAITKIRTVGKSVVRPLEILEISKEIREILNKQCLKTKIREIK